MKKELRKKKLEAKNTRYQAHLQKLIKGAPITLARCMGLDYRYRFKRMHYRSCKTDYFFKDDLRIENLQILCPNCHAYTDNYRGKNIGMSAQGETPEVEVG